MASKLLKHAGRHYKKYLVGGTILGVGAGAFTAGARTAFSVVNYNVTHHKGLYGPGVSKAAKASTSVNRRQRRKRRKR